jgi:hypothetical protein
MITPKQLMVLAAPTVAAGFFLASVQGSAEDDLDLIVRPIRKEAPDLLHCPKARQDAPAARRLVLDHEFGQPSGALGERHTLDAELHGAGHNRFPSPAVRPRGDLAKTISSEATHVSGV